MPKIYTQKEAIKKGDECFINTSRLILYHGSNNDFEQFDSAKIEKQPGFWFSEDKDYALSHGKILYEVAVDGANFLDLDTKLGEEYAWNKFPNEYNMPPCQEDNLYTQAFADFLSVNCYDGFCFKRTEGRTYVVSRLFDKHISILSKTRKDNK